MNYLNLYRYKYDKLNEIKKLLNSIVRDIPTLYSKEIVKINIHQLTHLIDCDIKLWGPIWTHNAFVYESMNGIFISHIHGTKKVPKSAINNLILLQNNPLKNIQIEFQNPNVTAFYEKLQSKKKQ